DAWRAARPAGDFMQTVLVDRHLEHFRSAGNELADRVNVVEVEAIHRAKPRAEWGGQQGEPCRRADHCEAWQIEPDVLGGCPLADDNIQREIFHRGIKYFLDRAAPTENLFDKHVIALAHVRLELGQLYDKLGARS